MAKWKRLTLAEYDIKPGYGIYTDMNAIRSDESLGNLHSLYVDQWDWERTITAEDRNIDFLKRIVRKIYSAMLRTEYLINETYPQLEPFLAREVFFIHSEELRRLYPNLSAKEREDAITKEHGTVFIMGIGGNLEDGKPHDLRAPDYDDWELNGDIILWNEILDRAFEISSMGIRVDAEAMMRQLKAAGCEDRAELTYQKAVLEDRLPYTIGGGIGQSRLCMFFLRKAHIGEVQASVWPEEMIEICEANNIHLL